MTFRHRVRTIYGKELTDILRDRRTLIAMIVVPIVLYPLLMLGSVQAVSYQHESLEEEKLTIGVADDRHRVMLQQLIFLDTRALEKKREELDPESDEAKELPTPLSNARIEVFGSVEEVQAAIRERRIPAGVVFDRDRLVDAVDQQVYATVHADYEEPRGTTAGRRVQELLDRTNKRLRTARLGSLGLNESFIQPYVVEEVDLSAPSSILGEVLPLILILMTITGAIYPAIDLTAGERERGTLESLMVCPVPIIDLIVGKFLVVTTVAIVGAALNLSSVTATVYFGGFDKIIASTGGRIPIEKMLFILLALIPFAVLMSAIMIAVCSYARTFKEAQNYVTPVILAVLIPGGIAALPATRLDGGMLVMPVGNMVLLAKELLLGAAVPAWHVLIVLLSTTLYAAAAVAVAAKTFGHESVVFADAGSLKAAFSRRMIRPSSTPPMSLSLLVTAVWFPLWFYVQSALSPEPGETAVSLLRGTAWLMPLLFVILPVAMLVYWKVDLVSTFSLRVPSLRHLMAGVLLGISAWVPAHELNVLQHAVVGIPESFLRSAAQLIEAMRQLPSAAVIVILAVLPACCEELLFRGFLLSGLASSLRKWPAILISAIFFAVFHFFLFKFVIAGTLGIVLGYLCWQSRSIVPAILAHALHNAIGVATVLWPTWTRWLGMSSDEAASVQIVHLPAHVLILGVAVFAVGLFAASKSASGPKRETLPLAHQSLSLAGRG